MRRTAALASMVAAALAVGSCRREEPPLNAGGTPCPPGQFCPGGQPPSTTPSGTATTPRPGGAPAFGLPCNTDLDLVCPLGRCISNRCGGCTTAADCKPGAACGWTPVGLACVPAGFGAPAPAPSPGGGPPPVIGGGGVPGGSDPFANARRLCVQRTNQLRAQAGAGPVAQNAAKEPCGDQEAALDAQSRTPHGAFGRCGEMAQNECPGWQGPADAMVVRCLDSMFAEGPGVGPGHGHYVNMTNRSYGSVACGFSVGADGQVWMVQNFF